VLVVGKEFPQLPADGQSSGALFSFLFGIESLLVFRL
jgi:hypothetical protein